MAGRVGTGRQGQDDKHPTDVNEDIIQTVTDFVRGGDLRDVTLLDRILHTDFRVTNNGFMGTPGVTVIDKPKYLENIWDGVFGGWPRKMEIEHIDTNGTIASVKLRLESAENDFISYNSLVFDSDGKWKIIENLAVVTPKK